MADYYQILNFESISKELSVDAKVALRENVLSANAEILILDIANEHHNRFKTILKECDSKNISLNELKVLMANLRAASFKKIENLERSILTENEKIKLQAFINGLHKQFEDKVDELAFINEEKAVLKFNISSAVAEIEIVGIANNYYSKFETALTTFDTKNTSVAELKKHFADLKAASIEEIKNLESSTLNDNEKIKLQSFIDRLHSRFQSKAVDRLHSQFQSNADEQFTPLNTESRKEPSSSFFIKVVASIKLPFTGISSLFNNLYKNFFGSTDSKEICLEKLQKSFYELTCEFANEKLNLNKLQHALQKFHAATDAYTKKAGEKGMFPADKLLPILEEALANNFKYSDMKKFISYGSESKSYEKLDNLAKLLGTQSSHEMQSITQTAMMAQFFAKEFLGINPTTSREQPDSSSFPFLTAQITTTEEAQKAPSPN